MPEHDDRYDIQTYLENAVVCYDIQYGEYTITAYQNKTSYAGYVRINGDLICDEYSGLDLATVALRGMRLADDHHHSR